MPDLHIVVLAAGKGTRMKSSLPKVLHRVAGRPMIDCVLWTAARLSPRTSTVVVGHMAELVAQALSGFANLTFVRQEPQLGTGHALLQVESALAGARGTLLLLSGDTPLITAGTLARLLATHERTGAAATVLTATLVNPYGYGRVIREGSTLAAIIEERDATPAERAIPEVNGGIYAFALAPLFDSLRALASGNAQGEYYLPDLIRAYRRRNLRVEALGVDEPDEIRGINSRAELAEASRIVRQTKNEALMAAGVTIEDPATTYIDADVTVGPDTVIHPGVFLEGRTKIGERCELHSGVRIIDAVLEDKVVVHNFCVIREALVRSGTSVGPFAHLRPGTELREGSRVGNFVELKKTVLGAGSKASHLAYLGDATIGERVNIGAGTITCNYDGVRKNPTTIEDEVFIGSDTQLIAPVRVGRGAYVAAGSSITEDVPPGALGIARGRQRNIPGWVERKKGH
jgi:bifunctional UDP-N-acetylglucosamine pyrophosphorylase / glucosamine-1-phosphate N-acetyltransferase